MIITDQSQNKPFSPVKCTGGDIWFDMGQHVFTILPFPFPFLPLHSVPFPFLASLRHLPLCKTVTALILDALPRLSVFVTAIWITRNSLFHTDLHFAFSPIPVMGQYFTLSAGSAQIMGQHVMLRLYMAVAAYVCCRAPTHSRFPVIWNTYSEYRVDYSIRVCLRQTKLGKFMCKRALSIHIYWPIPNTCSWFRTELIPAATDMSAVCPSVRLSVWVATAALTTVYAV